MKDVFQFLFYAFIAVDLSANYRVLIIIEFMFLKILLCDDLTQNLIKLKQKYNDPDCIDFFVEIVSALIILYADYCHC